ncbi:hypothetical protein vseg_012594 [Gypsophila vaccaria]
MEKPNNKYKNLFLKFIPKPIDVQNPTFTSKLRQPHARKAFSGPINFARLPAEARKKPVNGAYHTLEPTSPRASCMGQITTYKSKQLTKMKIMKSNDTTTATKAAINHDILMRLPTNINNNDDDNNNDKEVPSLGQMRKYASGRETTLGKFDWTAQIAPIDQ